jgi:tetratricopeptide (TPR) repeat protein
LELYDPRDRKNRGGATGQLGMVAYERFREGRAANQPEAELLSHLNMAMGFYLQALDLLPKNAVNDLAVGHNQIGSIYDDAGDLARALLHWREAIRYSETAGDLYHAATTRFNVALGLMNGDRLSDAAEYARAALRNYETYGQAAAAEIQKTQQLLAEIEQAMRNSPPGPLS